MKIRVPFSITNDSRYVYCGHSTTKPLVTGNTMDGLPWDVPARGIATIWIPVRRTDVAWELQLSVCPAIDLTDQLGAIPWTDTPIPVGFCTATRTGSLCTLAYERSDHAAERFDSASYRSDLSDSPTRIRMSKALDLNSAAKPQETIVARPRGA